MLQATYVHKKMIDGQSDNYLGSCMRKWFQISLEFEDFPKTQDIKKLKLLLEQNHQEQNQANGDASETTTTAEIKYMKSKLDRALRSWSFKLSS